MYQKELENGYKYVYTSILAHKKLYETSGHLAHYKDDMYSPIDIEGEEYYRKPMNCPHHHMIYKHGQDELQRFAFAIGGIRISAQI